jgi:hypothetical protein
VRIAAVAAALCAVVCAPAAATASESLPAATTSATTTITAATSTTAADEQALADKYAPVVRLVEQPTECGPGEPFIPTDVNTLFGDDSVSLRGPWDADDLVRIGPPAEQLGEGLTGYHLDFPGDPLNPGCSYEEWARELTAGSSPTTYARVVTEPGRVGVALQYWLYYPFNDFNNKHESDWEMVQIEFAAPDAAAALAQDPTRLGYSQHEGVELADWGSLKLQVEDDTHPVVHPAAGSHANYYDESLFLGRSGQQGFGCDDTRGPSRDVTPAVVLIPSDAAAISQDLPWLDYTGRWGQRERSFYNGPTGPNTKDQWTAPLTWTDEEGADVSYAVPASGIYGTEATTFFCTVVASGSDALRLAMSNPGWAVLLLIGAALMVAWLVRQTTWQPSEPLRLARRRSTGQIIAAVWRLYLRRLPLFLGIGLPIAVTTTLPGVAQVWLDSSSEALGGTEGAPGLLVVLGSIVLTLLAPINLVLGQSAVAVAAREIDAGRPIGVLGAYAGAFRRGGAALLTVGLFAILLAALLLTVVLSPVAVVLLVAGLLMLPVVVLEGSSGWTAFRRSALLVRPRWIKVVVLVGLTTGTALAIGPILGTTLILATSLPFAVSNAVSGVVYALLVPIVGLAYVYVYADAVARHELEPRQPRSGSLPAEVTLP